MQTLPKILTSLLVTGVVASSALLISNAFFSDTENSTGNTFQAGELDLKIDNTSYYNGQLNSGTTWEMDNLPQADQRQRQDSHRVRLCDRFAKGKLHLLPELLPK